MRTQVASHRGGALEWPENSPTAFRGTAALPVDQVEFDIHPTADGHIVVIHDALLDRTTSATGPVAARTLAELQAVDLLGTGGEHMLSLPEFCALFAPTGIGLRMEVKPDHAHRPYPGLLPAALSVLDRAGLRGRTVVTSFQAETASLAAATPGLAGAIWLVAPPVQDDIAPAGIAAVAAGAGVRHVGIRQNRLDAEVLAALRDQRLGVGAWAVNDEASIGAMLRLGVDVFTTDRPTMALQLRDALSR